MAAVFMLSAKAKPRTSVVAKPMADSSRRTASGEEDLRDLNDAIVRNAGKPGSPWAKVKKELGLG